MTTKNNFAFIDGQNLHSGVRQAGWKLDHKKFREFLREEFDITRAYIFIGYMEEQQSLYSVLQEAGFILFFKPLLRYEDGTVKGNVDAELIVQTLIEKDKYDQALIVSGDGDFSSMLRHLNGENKLKGIIIPNKFNYSSLFKRLDGFDKDLVTFIGDHKARLAYGSIKRSYHHGKPKKPELKGKRPVLSKKAPIKKSTPKKPVSTTSSEKGSFKPKAELENDLLATIAAQEPEVKKPAPKPKTYSTTPKKPTTTKRTAKPARKAATKKD